MYACRQNEGKAQLVCSSRRFLDVAVATIFRHEHIVSKVSGRAASSRRSIGGGGG